MPPLASDLSFIDEANMSLIEHFSRLSYIKT